MCAFDGVGEDRLFKGAQRRSLANVDTVDSALERGVADADISIARCGWRRVHCGPTVRGIGDEITLPVIKVKPEIVTHLVIGKGCVD